MMVSFAGIAECTATIAKVCDISGLYSRKNLQTAAFNYNFM
jgi:hypothetical protein